jgi:hypothetical protein
VDEAFVNKLRTELFNQYNNVDAVAEYIAVHQECAADMISCGHKLDIIDVRLEPKIDRVVVYYTVATDGVIRYRTSYPFRWEVFLGIVNSFDRTGYNPWTQQRYEYSSIVNVFGRMRKMKGPAIREMPPEEEIRILNEQDSNGDA